MGMIMPDLGMDVKGTRDCTNGESLAAGMHGEDHEQRVGRRSGVDRLPPAPKIRATSSGTVKGDAMTLKVVVEGEESEPPEYRLLRG